MNLYDKIADALDARTQEVKPHNVVRWSVANRAAEAWRHCDHPLEAANAHAAYFHGQHGAQARFEARALDRIVTSILKSA